MSDLPQTVVAPEAGSQLEQLHALYESTGAAADEAAARHKTVTDAIKVALTEAAPEGATRVVLAGEQGPRLALAYSERRTIDSKRLRREQPDVAAAYEQVGGSWSLRVAKDGE